MRRLHRTIPTVAALALLVACAPAAQQEAPPLSASFTGEDVAWATGKGSNRIVGDAKIREGGELFSCGSYTVFAIPDSAYARERVKALFNTTGKGMRPANAPAQCLGPDYPAYRQTQRTASCDTQGNFAFDNLPDGTWYITTSVIWQEKLGQPYKGGTFVDRVSVNGGATARVRLAE